jgi:hypothetical protein
MCGPDILLSAEHAFNPSFQPIDLSYLTTLRSLFIVVRIENCTLGGALDVSGAQVRNPFPWLNHVISTLDPMRSTVEEITVAFSMREVSDLQKYHGDGHGPTALDDALTRPGMLRIKTINIHAANVSPPPPSGGVGGVRTEYLGIVQSMFPQLWKERGGKLGLCILSGKFLPSYFPPPFVIFNSS